MITLIYLPHRSNKFVYLKSLLTGEAAGYVANFKIEEANYELAVERFQSRDGKDDVERNRLMTKLADIKPIDQSNKAMRETQWMNFVQLFERFKYKELLRINM